MNNPADVFVGMGRLGAVSNMMIKEMEAGIKA